MKLISWNQGVEFIVNFYLLISADAIALGPFTFGSALSLVKCKFP